MPASPGSDVTRLLVAWSGGDRHALDRLIPLVYAELRVLAHRQMRGERQGHPLQSTALINEAYLRLIDIHGVRWQNRAHFFAVAARVMRRVLVDAARERAARKRGHGIPHVPFHEEEIASPDRGIDILALDEALNALATLEARKARVVELRYFGGLSVEETAQVLAVSPDTVMRDWKMAKLWLLRELSRTAPG